MERYDNDIEAIEDANYKKCDCCGMYYYIENGACEYEDLPFLNAICNDCIELIEDYGIPCEDIPYEELTLEDLEEEEE